jgi:hypothetical protein
LEKKDLEGLLMMDVDGDDSLEGEGESDGDIGLCESFSVDEGWRMLTRYSVQDRRIHP